MRLGAPVTALSLSPAMDLLATCHVERRGVYLWSNQLMFGSGADVVPSDRPVSIRLPSLSTGRQNLEARGAEQRSRQQQEEDEVEEMLARTTAAAGARAAAEEERGGSSDGDEGGDVAMGTAEDGSYASDDSEEFLLESEEEEEEEIAAGRQQQQPAAELDPTTAAAASAYAARDAAGAPAPLEPQMVTLSMLPRTQVHNLVHLDTIKARNKPVDPPKKPHAAPFFLPTLVGAHAGRQPVFGTDAGAHAAGEGGGGSAAPPRPEVAEVAAAAWGDGDEEDEGAGGPGTMSTDPMSDSDAEAVAAGGSQAVAAAAAGRAGQRGAGSAGGSRVVRSRGQGQASQFVSLLEQGSASGDWTSLAAGLRALPPVQVDAEIRSLQVGDPRGGGGRWRAGFMYKARVVAGSAPGLCCSAVHGLSRIFSSKSSLACLA